MRYRAVPQHTSAGGGMCFANNASVSPSTHSRTNRRARSSSATRQRRDPRSSPAADAPTLRSLLKLDDAADGRRSSSLPFRRLSGNSSRVSNGRHRGAAITWLRCDTSYCLFDLVHQRPRDGSARRRRDRAHGGASSIRLRALAPTHPADIRRTEAGRDRRGRLSFRPTAHASESC